MSKILFILPVLLLCGCRLIGENKTEAKQARTTGAGASASAFDGTTSHETIKPIVVDISMSGNGHYVGIPTIDPSKFRESYTLDQSRSASHTEKWVSSAYSYVKEVSAWYWLILAIAGLIFLFIFRNLFGNFKFNLSKLGGLKVLSSMENLAEKELIHYSADSAEHRALQKLLRVMDGKKNRLHLKKKM